MIHSTEDILVKRYRINEFPKIIIVKTTERKPIPYKGIIKYHEI